MAIRPTQPKKTPLLIRPLSRLPLKIRCGDGYGIAGYPPGATFGPRTTRDFEFVWIIEGDVVWEYDGVERAVPLGTVLLSRPGVRESYRWDPLYPTRHGFFHFDIESFGADLPEPSTWPLMRQLREGDIIRPLFHHLEWLLATRPASWQLLSEQAMRHVLLTFVSGSFSSAEDAGAAFHPLVEKVMAHVCCNWVDGRLEALSLDRLAGAAGVSRAHLARVFREHLGVTPVEAIRIMRLDRAATLLARTNLAINAVADQTGFDNAFHFSRVFHERYGSSPRAFRARLANGADMPTIELARVRELSKRMWRSV